MIKTPTNVKLLTNVAVVRMKKCGKRFEIACYKNKAVSWRNKTERNINEVLQTQTIFSNVSKGQIAKRSDLVVAFGTTDELEICTVLLEKGELQVAEKERQAQLNSSFKEVVNMICSMCVNPKTKRNYSANIVENALRELHFSFNTNQSVKMQALKFIPKLQEMMPIERAQMKIRASVPINDGSTKFQEVKALFISLDDQERTKDSHIIVGLVEPGNYRRIVNIIGQQGSRTGKVEVLSLKVVVDSDVDLSSYDASYES